MTNLCQQNEDNRKHIEYKKRQNLIGKAESCSHGVVDVEDVVVGVPGVTIGQQKRLFGVRVPAGQVRTVFLEKLLKNCNNVTSQILRRKTPRTRRKTVRNGNNIFRDNLAIKQLNEGKMY